jgi:hypothetical protein
MNDKKKAPNEVPEKKNPHNSEPMKDDPLKPNKDNPINPKTDEPTD